MCTLTGCRKTAVLNLSARIAVVFTLAGKTLGGGTDIRHTTVCGLTKDCNVRNHNPKGLLALLY